MEPQIRYVKSADGTRIGYWALGRGRPLVIMPTLWIFSIHSLWQVPEIRANVEHLAQKRTVVLYDARGQGTSSRDVTDFSLDAYVADLDAVVTHLDAAQVDMLAISFSAMPAIAYAARHLESVRRLVLANAWVRGRDFRAAPEARALSALIDVNWELYLRTLALTWFGWTETGRIIAEMTSRDASRETMVAGFAEARRTDVTSILPDVTCPALLLKGETAPMQLDDLGEGLQDMAAVMPNARLVTYADDSPLVLTGRNFLRIVEEFLDERDEAQPPSAHPEPAEAPSGTAVILFADIVDSTALTERLGDDAFREKARGLDEAMRAAIRDNGGTPVEGKTLGDGVLAVFTSAKQAIACAQACHHAATAAGLSLHAGIHAGDVIREADNVYGGAVNIAARIAATSAAGETLVSATVRELARTSAGVSFEDRGEHSLKGIDDPVRVWAVRQA
jgi:class 3 adenylate cyclase/pimeloyl-ACP methyl ester carboxylesterase